MVHFLCIALAASFAATAGPTSLAIGCQDQESLNLRELKLDVRELRLNSQDTELRLSRIEQLLQQLRSGLLPPAAQAVTPAPDFGDAQEDP